MTDGTLIGFTVLWKNQSEQHGSLTTFAGWYLVQGEQDGLGDPSRERIEAQWVLACRYDDDDPHKPHTMTASTWASGPGGLPNEAAAAVVVRVGGDRVSLQNDTPARQIVFESTIDELLGRHKSSIVGRCTEYDGKDALHLVIRARSPR